MFRGWRIVGAGFVVQAIQAAVLNQAYGNYTVVLKQEFGWSSTMFSVGWSLIRLESGLLGPPHGWALDRFGVRRVMRFGVIVMAIGFGLLSTVETPVEFIGYFVLTAIGASLCGFLTVVTTTVRWFNRKRSTALALTQGGFALGGIAAPALVWVLENYGWRTAFAGSGVLSLAVILPLTFVFVDRPDQVGEHPDGEAPGTVLPVDRGKARLAASTAQFTARQAMATRAFWLISLGHAAALLVVGAVLAHLSPYLVNEQGFTLGDAAVVGSVLLVFQLVGQFVGGYLGDRYSKRVITSLAMFGHVAGLLVLAGAHSPAMVWVFVPFHGLAWGIRGPLMQSWRADYFGAASFGQIMGISSMIIMFGQIGGPLLAGILEDTTGSFRIGFTIVAITASLGTLAFALAARPASPAPDPVTADLATAAG